MDYTVLGILQSKILEWVGFPFCRRSSHPRIEPRSHTLQALSLPPEPQGSPVRFYYTTYKGLGKQTFQFSRSVVSDSSQSHRLQHVRLPCSSPTPGACSNSRPWSQWCHTTISSSVIHFSSRLQSLPASQSIPKSQFFTSDGQSFAASVSASVLPMNIQNDFL